MSAPRGSPPRGSSSGKPPGQAPARDRIRRAGGSSRRRPPREATSEELLEQVIAQALRFESPADAVLRGFFSSHREMGQRDRARVAETLFDILRNRRLYAHLAQSTGQGSLAARMITVHDRRADIDVSVLGTAVRFSLPDWLHDRLAAKFPPSELQALAAAMLEPAPLDLRANLLKSDREAAMASLRAQGIDCEPSPMAPQGIRVRGKPALERTDAFRDGLVEVQDCGSQLIAHLVAPRRGQTVVDFCAGAGGKTLALAALMRGTGQVFACDVSATRLQRLRPRLARSGATNVQPFGIDHEGDPKLERLAGRADAVLVDAPCSGSGTLRRNPDLKWRVGESDIAELPARQRSILAAAARLVRPGGVLVYATCSLLDEENAAVRAWFEAQHPGWRVDDAPAVLARQGAVIDPVLDARVMALRPDTHGTDAFYAVRWVREG